jgi:hypothetical protein
MILSLHSANLIHRPPNKNTSTIGTKKSVKITGTLIQNHTYTFIGGYYKGREIKQSNNYHDQLAN